MKTLALLLLCVVVAGCNSQANQARLAEDQRAFQQVARSEIDGLQWKIDKATAEHIFYRYYSDAPPEPTPAYDTFIKCHEEPPTHDANKKVCAALQARVANQEAKDKAKQDADKAKW
jgi:hypothetical protein